MHQQIVAMLLALGFSTAVVFKFRCLAVVSAITAVCGLAYYLAQARHRNEILSWGLLAVLPMLFYSKAFLAGSVVGLVFRSATSTHGTWRLVAVVICAVAVTAFVAVSKSAQATRDTSYAETRVEAITIAKELVSRDARVLALTGQVQEIPLINDIVNRDMHKLLGISLYVKGVKGNALVETRLSREGTALHVAIVSVQVGN